MSYETLLIKTNDNILTIILNKPKSMNAFSLTMFNELNDAFNEINKREDIRVLIIKGAGRTFSAGGEMEMLNTLNQLKGAKLEKTLTGIISLASKFMKLRQPTISSIHGYCLGVGCSIAMLSDIRIASEDAVLGLEFVGMGIIPDTGALYSLPRIIGLSKAKELALTNRRVNSQEAEKIGMVNSVVPRDQLETKVEKVACQIASLPPIAIEMTKKLLNDSLRQNLDEILRYEALAQTICLNTEDHKEAVSAFLSKRKPFFTGK
ncbi:enoyl-CoA hydratase/isomerase family protein [Desulfoscipio sp. XC116]|uniref:enoyl-CoA hydratase/isomerase family protein n=1 Tax=Desulfoscipio sp. XC116 TaxID=3144975 RepID=UPI00325BB2AF